MDPEDDEYPLNLDSPKRHSDPAPCTSSNDSRPSSTSAFAFSVPDLRSYSQGTLRGSSASPARSPLPDGTPRSGTPSPARPSLGATRRGRHHLKHRRYSQGYPSPPLTSSYFTTAGRRATHPHMSPGRFRRTSLWVEEDPWATYRARSGSIPVPNGDDKPFAADEGCYRLRSFSVTSKGIVNLGDMVRARSPSVTSEDSSSGVEHDFRERLSSVESTISVLTPPTRYKVLLLGAEEVGKSSLLAQFTTSECLTTVATDMQESLDGSQERTVSLLVDGEETELSCEDPHDSTFEVEDSTFASTDAFLLVYSVTNRKTLSFAFQTLEKLRRKEAKCQYIYPNLGPKVYILVANKVDLVRSRVIPSGEGRSFADRYDIKYIETSVGFNHNVDELLVGIVTQIRLKKQQHQNSRTSVKNFIAKSMKFTNKAKGFMDKLLQKCDLKTRSCDNLNVL
ncbi:GTP-binding protein GEM-like [Parasteatoda tepidariorum]|uniref:GTP-binding protein GEM-like n=1 Tax=Parasteatoda tepidariorum TaxID=114398 RepID=UPI001C71FD05|nr:GTP-binding protein GEM-like [Parasteatoda tepidariorum]